MKIVSSKALRKLYGRKHLRYLELIRLFPLRPIRTEDDLDAATVIIHMLVDLPKLSKPEDDYLAVLTDLVYAYEEVHYPMGEDVSDADMLRSLLDSKAGSVAQVAKEARIAESTISEVLSGKRKLNRTQIGKLAKYFHVEPGVFSFGE